MWTLITLSALSGVSRRPQTASIRPSSETGNGARRLKASTIAAALGPRWAVWPFAATTERCTVRARSGAIRPPQDGQSAVKLGDLFEQHELEITLRGLHHGYSGVAGSELDPGVLQERGHLGRQRNDNVWPDRTDDDFAAEAPVN